VTKHEEPVPGTPTASPVEEWATPEEKIQFYGDHYSVLARGTYSVGPKIFVGSRESRRCRFCGKAEPETTFKNVAHAIPAFLGNDQLLTNSECDSCNTFFADNLETHLDKYTRPHRLAAQIRGRRGVPSYRSNDKASRVEFKSIMTISAPKNSGFVTLDEEQKTLQLNMTREPYIPAAVYKALCKIAISTIDTDEEISNFRPAIAWVRDPDHKNLILSPLKVAATFVPGPRPFEGVSFLLLRKKSTGTLPHCIFVLAAGNHMYQLIVPTMPDATGTQTFNFRFPQFPVLFEAPWRFGEIKYGMIDFTSTEYVTKDAPMSFSYSESHPADAPTQVPPTQS